MPAYKVWDSRRQEKSMVVCNSIDELIEKGGDKLKIKACSVVLEEDGTRIDDDQVLMAVQSQTLILLSSGEEWTSVASQQFDSGKLNAEGDCQIITSHSESSALTSSLGKSPISWSSKRSRCDGISLPVFSPFVSNKLESGQGKAVWSKVIEESAHFFMAKYPNIGSAEDYKSIGHNMYTKYPASIKHEGNEPWSYFNRSLSQKIRNLRWSLKRKSDDLGSASVKPPQRCNFSKSSSPAHSPCGQSSDDDSEKHIETIQSEMDKEHPNAAHIKLLLKESFNQRRRWMTTITSGQLLPIITKYPCFELGEFVLMEFYMVTNKTMEQLHARADTLISSVDKMTQCRKGPLQMLDVMEFIEVNTKFDRGKGTKSRSFVTVHEDAAETDTLTLTKPLDSPRLVIFVHNNEVQQCVVCGDTIRVVSNPKTVVDCIILLLGVYYTFDLDYPKIFSQGLGFLQQFIVGDKYTGQMSSRFSKFCTKYQALAST